MNCRSAVLAAPLLMALSMAGCSPGTQGPMTWMDRPLDGQRVALAALTIQAHSSDENGVAKMQFFVADALLAEAPTGGQRLSNASVDWMPPGPGTYMVSARAIDGAGNYGPAAHAQIVVSGSIATAALPPTARPGQTSLPPAPAARSLTTTPPSAPLVSGAPSATLTQNANCRTGPGTAFENIDTLLKGINAVVEGRNEQNSWLMVRKPGGRGTCWVSTVSVVVQGDLNRVPVIGVAAPVVPPPGGVEVPPAQVQDVTPPTISNVSLDPATIQQSGCGAPDTFTVRATVTDPSGVGNVIYELQGPGGQGGEWYLQPAGGDQYQATGGPLSGGTGAWSLGIQATDLAGNTGQAGPWTLQVTCIQ